MTLFILLRRELKSIFLSPIAYVILAMAMALNAFSFSSALDLLQRQAVPFNLVRICFFELQWFWISYFFLFPLITMRLFAEERKMGTIETLLTAPIRPSTVIAAKYLAAIIFYIVLWIPPFLNLALFSSLSGDALPAPAGIMAGTAVILLASGAFHLAVGLFTSSLTSNQIVAAMSCFGIIMLHFAAGYVIHFTLDRVPPQLREIAIYTSTWNHLNTFTSGVIDSRPIVYYLSLSALLLALTHQLLELRRWKA